MEKEIFTNDDECRKKLESLQEAFEKYLNYEVIVV